MRRHRDTAALLEVALPLPLIAWAGRSASSSRSVRLWSLRLHPE